MTRAASIGLYDDPLVYDILHAPGTRREAVGLVRIVRRFAPSSGPLTILEPACGTGRYLESILRLGHAVGGYDASASMIEFAQKRLRAWPRRVTLFRALMGDEPNRPRIRADAAFTPINSIRHVPSDRAMTRHLRWIARSLRPGGVYVVGLSLTAYGIEGPTEDVWTGTARGTRVHQVVQYLPAPGGRRRAERVISHLTVWNGRRVTDRTSNYALRSYSLDQWTACVRASGMEMIATVDESGADIVVSEPGYALFVLRPTQRAPMRSAVLPSRARSSPRRSSAPGAMRRRRGRRTGATRRTRRRGA